MATAIKKVKKKLLYSDEFDRQYRFSAEIRWAHWIRALVIFVLIFTGFYLASPFITPAAVDEPIKFQNALFRFWHMVCGFILMAITTFRVYLYFFDAHSRQYEWASMEDARHITSWIRQIKSYLYLDQFPKRGMYGPLQNASYLILMLIVIAEVLTGAILYSHVYHNGMGHFFGVIFGPLEYLMGGLANVRNIHYIFMWCIIIFIPIHIYMVFWYANRYPGSIDVIFSGNTFRPHDPEKD